jgi:hypothetical protein
MDCSPNNALRFLLPTVMFRRPFSSTVTLSSAVTPRPRSGYVQVAILGLSLAFVAAAF